MKIWFIGIKPPAGLAKVLLVNQFQVEVLKQLPPHRASSTPDIILFAPKIMTQTKMLKTMRHAYPDSWISLLVERKWLKSPTQQNDLLNVGEKDEICIREDWETLFWFSIQKAIRHRELNENYLHLSQRSRQLVSQFEKDLGLASKIQRSLLPEFSPEIPGVSIGVKYIPAAGLGGDYYDIFEFGDRKRFGLLLADSKTHGLAAALLSGLVKVRLEEMKDRFPHSRSFVEYLNKEIQGVHEKSMATLSLLYGILDRSTLNFQYTVAGSLRPLLWRNGKSVPLPSEISPPIGEIRSAAFRENQIDLRPGDLLVFFTDGLEAPVGRGQSTAEKKIIHFLNENGASDPLELQNELMSLIDRHREERPLADDITLIHLYVAERALYVAQNK